MQIQNSVYIFLMGLIFVCFASYGFVSYGLRVLGLCVLIFIFVDFHFVRERLRVIGIFFSNANQLLYKQL